VLRAACFLSVSFALGPCRHAAATAHCQLVRSWNSSCSRHVYSAWLCAPYPSVHARATCKRCHSPSAPTLLKPQATHRSRADRVSNPVMLCTDRFGWTRCGAAATRGGEGRRRIGVFQLMFIGRVSANMRAQVLGSDCRCPGAGRRGDRGRAGDAAGALRGRLAVAGLPAGGADACMRTMCAGKSDGCPACLVGMGNRKGWRTVQHQGNLNRFYISKAISKLQDWFFKLVLQP